MNLPAENQRPSLLETVRSFLDRKELTYFVPENSIYVRTSFSLDHGYVPVAIECWDEAERLKVYVSAPVAVPAPARQAAAELCSRINWDLGAASFELDFSDGELRLRGSTIVPPSGLEEEMIETLLFGSLNTMDRFLPAFLSLAFGGQTPEEALALIPEDDE